MTDIAIRVENLSKRYRIGLKEQAHDTFVGALTNFARQPIHNLRNLRRLTRFDNDGHESEDIIWALRDVSFQVERGEVVGVIGRNGAGKTTLLKILSHITEPTSGRVELCGRVASLLEVGTGFHPELTGRENVYLNGTILGMRREEIDRKFDEIVDFSGVEKFIDTPVKRYSSGMRVRLAFAVAAHLEPEILLIDEVLAVGDAEFQKKCLGKMEKFAGTGRTVLFVSHNMPAVANLCERSVLLEQGKLVADGTTSSLISRYHAISHTADTSRDLQSPSIERSGTGEALFQRVEILTLSGKEISSIPMGSGLKVRLSILALSTVTGIEIAIGMFNSQGLRLCGLNSHDTGAFIFDLDRNAEALIECTVPEMNVAPGIYRLNLLMRKRDGMRADFVEQAISVEVVPSDIFGMGRIPRGQNLIYLYANWNHIG